MSEISEVKDPKGDYRIPERVLSIQEASSAIDFRQLLADWLYRETVGPRFEDYQTEEGLTVQPSQLYSAGILFPKVKLIDESEGNALDDVFDDIEIEGVVEEPPETELKNNGATHDARQEPDDDSEITRANDYRPSALGVSFVVPVTVKSLEVKIFASKYISGKYRGSIKNRYIRMPLDIAPQTIEVSAVESIQREDPREVSSSLFLYVTRRPTRSNTLVTVSIVNKKISDSHGKYEDMFFQTGIEVNVGDSNESFLPYTQVIDHKNNDEEVAILDLLYRDRKAYAVGHGSAASWDVTAEVISKISSNPLPEIKIPPVAPVNLPLSCLSMWALTGEGDYKPDEIPDLLEELPEVYEEWIRERLTESKALDSRHEKAASNNLKSCGEAASRIRDGIELLREDDFALKAFCVANKAMLMQQVHYGRPTRTTLDDWDDFPNYAKDLKPDQGRWRVFQLAFILMNLRGGYRGFRDPSRELVDLIWFPTGGGKTEAYLGLSAYVIFIRRLNNPLDAGCTILMRYTLRLLTVQQFQRACSLICACERIRSSYRDKLLGDERISIGLWVGATTTPNKRKKANEVLISLQRQDGKHENAFQILKCPWCGTSMDQKGSLGYVRLKSSVRYVCPETRCDFSRNNREKTLPILVIDEDIYDTPPTLIIGTVDKFAMLAWTENAGSIFGGMGVSPPEVIIQDELHLISGPVGTMVGLYESVIGDLCIDENGVGPKIVGSTATIRRARDQCAALYNRDVVQFPPQGLTASDNFFAVENKEDPGRLYLGFMPTGASSFVTGLVRAFAALFEGVNEIDATDEIKDGYWTLIQYYNSLRELGRGVTFLQQDIPEWMSIRARADGRRARGIYHFNELTARKNSDEIPKILEALSIGKSEEKNSKPFDSLLATNMISVGVDVPRLGLMAVVGQPKTTSEYIQASSRVGRGSAPGLVVACYNPSKARDRSHFETFTQYHNAIYRHVEPTSVTPYAVPALEKALHAVLIIAARHIAKVVNPSDFDREDSRFTAFCERLRQRCYQIDPFHVEVLDEMIEQFVGKTWDPSWHDSWGSLSGFDSSEKSLMAPPNTSREDMHGKAVATPSSMRGVDSECEAEVLYQRGLSSGDQEARNER